VTVTSKKPSSRSNVVLRFDEKHDAALPLSFQAHSPSLPTSKFEKNKEGDVDLSALWALLAEEASQKCGFV
jgi:hypothetical protein